MIQEDLQGPLDKYIVKCIGCAETVEVFEVPGQFTNLTISYLDKDAEYSFFVSVATDKGLNDTAEPDILIIPKHSEGNCVKRCIFAQVTQHQLSSLKRHLLHLDHDNETRIKKLKHAERKVLRT